SAPSGAWLPSNDSGVSGHFDRDLALHAQLLVVVDRAVELVLARLQIDRQVSALSGGNAPLELLIVAGSHVLDLERMRRLAIVLQFEGPLSRLHAGAGWLELSIAGVQVARAARAGRRCATAGRGLCGPAGVRTGGAVVVAAAAAARDRYHDRGPDGEQGGESPRREHPHLRCCRD